MSLNPKRRQIRIGLDVGGTFTHAVAVDTSDFSLLTQTRTHTTHHFEGGATKGINTTLVKLLRKGAIDPEEVVLVAYSTTQVINALLEGDVAKVGIVGLGRGLKSWRVKRETFANNLELSPGKYLRTCHRYLDTGTNFNERRIREAIVDLKVEGAEALVAAEPFAVDSPRNEQRVVRLANDLGLPATASHEVSNFYGLRIRTRTAVINASLLPLMIKTAAATEQSIRATGIRAPMMIMRSDGGVMDVAELCTLPILALASTPAASIAAALMYARLPDGIMVDVGGTATDAWVIRNGSVRQRTARIGRYKLHFKALDVRSVGVAGGSLSRVANGEIVAIGPRSAHIAGMPYESFSFLQRLKNAEPAIGAPLNTDSHDYLFLQHDKGRIAITMTGAANAAGLVPDYDNARGGEKNVDFTFKRVATLLSKPPEQIADVILTKGGNQVIAKINELIRQYGLTRRDLHLRGCGGGASAILPYVASKLQAQHSLAPHSSVFAAIGGAFAMVRDTIDRHVVSPTETDLLKIRQDAERALLKRGVAPDSLQVEVRVDARRNSLNAVATGTTDPALLDRGGRLIPPEQRLEIVAQLLNVVEDDIEVVTNTEVFTVLRVPQTVSRFFGLVRQLSRSLLFVDQFGVIRLRIDRAKLKITNAAKAAAALKDFIEELTVYGDSGAQIPGIRLIAGHRLIDYTFFASEEHVLALATRELQNFTKDTPILLTAELRN